MSTAQDSTVVIGYPAGAYQVDTGYPYPPSPARSSPASSSPARSNYDQPTRPNPQLTKFTDLLIAILTILGIIVVVFSIGLLPTLSRTDPKFKLESATVSRLNATGSELTAMWNITLLVTNPEHRYRLSFKTLQAWLLYRDHSRPILAATPLLPFVVNKRNQTRLDMKLATVSQWVGGDVGKEIYDDRSRGFLSFRLRLRVCFRYDFVFEDKKCYLVDCDPVHFGFFHNETGMLIEQRECVLDHD